MLFDTKAVPFTAVFWRTHTDHVGRCTDISNHRNPLFCDELGTDPSHVLAVDSLHSVYYGPMQKWASATLWRILLRNPWNLPGPDSAVLDLGVRRLRTHMLEYFTEAAVPHNRRVGDLTLTMLGERRGCVVRGDHPHPGTALKTKAAETGIMFNFALSLLQTPLVVGAGVQHYSDLVISGKALDRWMETTRSTNDICLSVPECQILRDEAQRHLIHCRKTLIAMVPKHYFFAEMSIRAHFMGNPRMYNCFEDEGLNMVLRELAAHSHRLRSDERIHTHIKLIGKLKPHLNIAP